MNVADLLCEKSIVPRLGSGEKWEAIEELVGKLQEMGGLEGTERGAVLEALREREDQISTGIGSGVAIPHAFCEKIEEVAVMFGRSEGGIDFEAVDNAPVHFILLFVVPVSQRQSHLRTLASIGRLFQNGEARNELRDAMDAESCLEVLRRRGAAC